MRHCASGRDGQTRVISESCSSLFKYCLEVLHLSESQTYLRIDVARFAQKYPVVLEMLADGLVHLTAVHRLGPSLTEENHLEVLNEAVHKTKEGVEEIVARLRPKPPVPSMIRKLPNPSAGTPLVKQESGFFENRADSAEAVQSPRQGPSGELQAEPVRPAPSRKPVVAPVAPEIYKVQFTATAATRKKLEQVQEMLRHRVPNGDIGRIFEMGLDLLLEEVSRERFAKVKQPRKTQADKTKAKTAAHEANPSDGPQTIGNEEGLPARSRHIPNEVKRAVWDRDQGCCAFVSKSGKRCSQRNWIEYHHVEPFAWGGKSTVENLQLRCRIHNAYEGEMIFGKVIKNAVKRSRVTGATGSGTSSRVSPEELVLEPVDHKL